MADSISRRTVAVFEGLVFDETGEPARVVYVGDDPTYVVVEDGFRYHVDARGVDQQVMDVFARQMHDNEGLVSEAILKMTGKDDLFAKATVDAQIKQIDKQMHVLFNSGLPESARQYLGMLGFRIVINRSGDVIDLNLPSAVAPEDGE